MENVLIIGGNRFVGKALSERLLHNGVQVDVFNRSGTSSDGVKVIQGDRNKPEDIEKIDFTKYDCIVDMCLFFESQFDLIEHLIPNETNYIFISSGGADDRYIEHYGKYGIGKKKVESRLEESDINYKIVRPTYIVGKGNHRPRLGYYMHKMLNREHIEIAGDGKNTINIVFVQDVVNCLEELIFTDVKTAVQHPPIEVVGRNIEVIDLIHILKNWVTIRGSQESEVMLVQDDENAIISKNNFVFDRLIGLSPSSFDDRLRDYVNWYYKEGAKGYGHNI